MPQTVFEIKCIKSYNVFSRNSEDEMRRICLIATGGTIACVQTERGLAPKLAARDLLSYIGGDTGGIDCIDLFSMDSSNIQPEEWQQIASCIDGIRPKYDAIVLTHGTDTMAYTSSMLSFMLRGIDIPVIITGAQYPIVREDSDGRKNLRDAVTAARMIGGGVYICFGGIIISGCRAVKTRTTSLDAFESINAPPVCTVEGDEVCYVNAAASLSHYSFSPKIDPRVALIKLIPGTSPEILDSLAACGMRGVVVEAFGLGGVHSFRRDHTESLIRLMEKGITVILASQCLYEASTPDIYEVSRPLKDAGIIPAYDMTTEAAVTKLMWVLGQTSDRAKIRKMMLTNLCGELRA